jgi:hypothetical protein
MYLNIFNYRMLRKIFGPEREEDELHSPYSSCNIVRVIKSRRMKWVWHVAHVGRGEVFTGFLLGGPKGRDH